MEGEAREAGHAMLYRQLGSADLEVSAVGLGTLPFGGAYGDIEERDAIRTIQCALDAGINFIDTSDNYGFGRAEEIVGRAIRTRRAEVVLATKGGTPWSDEGRITNDSRPETIRKAAESSLRRLRTDYIDLYQIHLPDPETPYEETVGALEELKGEGKVRHAGLSNFWAAELEEWLSRGLATANQMPYNFYHRDIEAAVLPLCPERRLSLIAYTPLLMGLFSGAIDEETRFAEGDHRAAYPQFRSQLLPQSVKTLRRLHPIAREQDLSLAQLALRWVITRPGVTCAIAGTKSTEHVQENARAGDRSLTDGELEQVERVLERTAPEVPRSIPMRVVQVRPGREGRIGVLEMGIKVRVPDSIDAGGPVTMDAVTGQVTKDEPLDESRP